MNQKIIKEVDNLLSQFPQAGIDSAESQLVEMFCDSIRYAEDAPGENRVNTFQSLYNFLREVKDLKT